MRLINKNNIKKLSIILLVTFLIDPIIAKDEFISLNGKNRFVSLKFNDVNARKGPSTKYPIIAKYNRKYLPLKIINKEDNWYQLQDIDKYISWIHVNNISGINSVILKGIKNKEIYKHPNIRSEIIGILKENAQCRIIKENPNYYKLNCTNFKGWVTKENLWGTE